MPGLADEPPLGATRGVAEEDGSAVANRDGVLTSEGRGLSSYVP